MNRGRGSGKVARDQAAALVGAGHEVTYMYAGMADRVMGADNVDVQLHDDTMPVHEYLPVCVTPQRRVSTMARDEARRFTADYVRALSAIESIDLIIAHHATITATAAAAVANGRQSPYAVLVHGTGIEPRHHGGYDDEVWSAIEDALQGAAGIIVTTDYVRDRLVRPLVAAPLDLFSVQLCGVDLEAFAPIPGTDIKAKYGLPERYVICPGALTYSKGPQNVVAASRFYADLAPTVFIGDGDLREEIQTNLGDRGRLLGFVPKADKDALIAGATILSAAPVKREHFGIIYVEAMAAGAVPVAYSGGGVDSIVTPDVGLLTERAPRALGVAVRRMLMDDWHRERLAVAGRQRVEERFDHAALGKRFVAWAEALVGDNLTRTGAASGVD